MLTFEWLAVVLVACYELWAIYGGWLVGIGCWVWVMSYSCLRLKAWYFLADFGYGLSAVGKLLLGIGLFWSNRYTYRSVGPHQIETASRLHWSIRSSHLFSETKVNLNLYVCVCVYRHKFSSCIGCWSHSTAPDASSYVCPYDRARLTAMCQVAQNMVAYDRARLTATLSSAHRTNEINPARHQLGFVPCTRTDFAWHNKAQPKHSQDTTTTQTTTQNTQNDDKAPRGSCMFYDHSTCM